MNFFEHLMSFDAHTVMGLLLWINLFLAGMIFTFETTMKTTQDRDYIKKAAMTRIAHAAAYLLLSLYDWLPFMVSLNLGYSILFFCFYLDACLMLSFLSAADKGRQVTLKIMLGIGIAAFNALELMFADGAIRAVASSLVILAIYGVPTVSFISKKSDSRFKRGIGGFYVLFLISLLPRIVIPIVEWFDGGGPAHEMAIVHSGFYLVLIIITVCGIISTLLFIKERDDIRLENMALYDQLTGIPNRHSFLHNADMLFLKCRREGRELSLLYTDIDYFKKVNDTYGHDFGDIVLKRYAAAIRESVRPYDLFCRYGGEEFLMMVQSDTEGVAEGLAARIMERLKTERFDGQPGFSFTISAGIATGIPGGGDTLDSYISHADAALYEAKDGGRNTVRFYKAVLK